MQFKIPPMHLTVSMPSTAWITRIVPQLLLYIIFEASASSLCCLRKQDICGCSPIQLTAEWHSDCPMRLSANTLKEHDITVRINETVPDGNYTAIALALDELEPGLRVNLAWVVFMGINIPSDKCLNTLKACRITLAGPITVGKCNSVFEHTTRLNVFLLKQTRVLNEKDLLWDMERMEESEIEPEPHIVDYSLFRDTAYFEGNPVRGTQYELIKCDLYAELLWLAQKTQMAYGADEIENYLFKPSPTYPVKLALSKSIHLVHVTEHMIQIERTDCEFERELKRTHFRGSLYHVIKPCSGFRLDNYTKQATQQSQLKDLLDRAMELGSAWLLELRQEYANLFKLQTLSGRNFDKIYSDEEELTGHHIDPMFANAYWKSLFKATRITVKLELYAEIIANITGVLPNWKLA
ncbi:hypothetical protein CRM22_001169 [Opisthorchis felineus]|uniref:Uncharacterized protein n=1 Tax=Opisthorchis felineus TaxID=147828 RepID=A0A4S2MBU3_OPIFE|nr:hypothetical protein CRM22_001169 [Opisthorchis felineus]